MKAIRWLLYIALTFFMFGLIEQALWLVIKFVYSWEINTLFMLILFPIYLGILAPLLAVTDVMSKYVMKISPDIKIGSKILTIVAVPFLIYLLYKVWQMPHVFTFYAVLFCLLNTILIIIYGGFVVIQVPQIMEKNFK